MEESITISSDSSQCSSPLSRTIGLDDDFDIHIPSVKISDICGGSSRFTSKPSNSLVGESVDRSSCGGPGEVAREGLASPKDYWGIGRTGGLESEARAPPKAGRDIGGCGWQVNEARALADNDDWGVGSSGGLASKITPSPKDDWGIGNSGGLASEARASPNNDDWGIGDSGWLASGARVSPKADRGPGSSGWLASEARASQNADWGSILDQPGPSMDCKKVLPRTNSFHELSDSDNSERTIRPDSPCSQVNGGPEIWDQRNDNRVAPPVHELSDSDSDTVPVPSQAVLVHGSSSCETLPPHSPHLFKSDFSNRSSDSSDTLPPNGYLWDDSSHPGYSSSTLPATDGAALLKSSSEPLFSTSYNISEFMSQPLDVDGGQKAKRKKTSAEDVLERKRLKEMKEKEKAERAAAAESLRRMRPNECLKYVTMLLDQRIVSDYPWGPAVVRILELSNTKHVVQMARDPCSVQWRRDQFGVPTPVEENHVLFIWSMEKLLTSVKFGTFIDTFVELKNRYASRKLLLAIYGLSEYYKKQSKAEQRKKRSEESQNTNTQPARKRKSAYEVSQTQIEMELIALQVRLGISHKALNSPQDTAAFLQVITKSVAELPFKLERERIDEERNWYAKGDSRNCVRIDKDFNGLSQLWLQQLAQFNNSSLDTAKAIAQVYRSPLALYNAYKEKETEKEKEQMLQEIVVKRGSGAGGRRLGPELSKKISIMFCQDQEIPLG